MKLIGPSGTSPNSRLKYVDPLLSTTPPSFDIVFFKVVREQGWEVLGGVPLHPFTTQALDLGCRAL